MFDKVIFSCLVVIVLLLPESTFGQDAGNRDWIEKPLMDIESARIVRVKYERWPDYCRTKVVGIYWKVFPTEKVSKEKVEQLFFNEILPLASQECSKGRDSWIVENFIDGIDLLDERKNIIPFSGYKFFKYKEEWRIGSTPGGRAVWNFASYNAAKKAFDAKPQVMTSNEISTLLSKDRAELAAFGDDLSALREMKKWGEQKIHSYSRYLRDASIKDLLEELSDKRSVVLRNYAGLIEEMILEKGNSEELGKLYNDFFLVPNNTLAPMDKNDPVGKELINLVRQQVTTLKKAEALARVPGAKEENERKAREKYLNSVCSGKSNVASSDKGEPTEEQMCRAVESFVDMVSETIHDQFKNCQSPDAITNPIRATECAYFLLLNPDRNLPFFTLESFQKKSCGIVDNERESGYQCKYVMGAGSSKNSTNALLKLGSGETIENRFVFSRGEWVVIRKNPFE